MACNYVTDNTVDEKKSEPASFFIGTYTNGSGEGIYRCSLTNTGQLGKPMLVAKSVSPSFLAFSADKKNLLAVNEIADENNMGTVESYHVADDSLLFVSRSSSGGAHPCHISINSAKDVLIANYTGGNVGLLKLKSDGKLSQLLDTQQHFGHGSNSRQEKPHAHSVWFVPNSNLIVSADLGTNELWFSQIDTLKQKLQYNDLQKMKMANGAGPRHVAFHPSGKWIYVVNELNSTITHVFLRSNQNIDTVCSVSTLPENFTGNNTCADIHVSHDGRFVYASNRGHNSLAIFSINQTTGYLNLVGFESTRGESPRNFTLSPNDDFILVANQLSNNIVSFKRDKNSGKITYVSQTEALTPVCLLF